MPDELRPTPLPATSAPRRPWSQPSHVDEPIIDAARVPLSAYFGRQGPSWSRSHKLSMYVWLHVLRPVITISVWAAGLWYAWPYVLDAPTQADTQRLLWLYAAIIGGIFMLMLVAAPLRRGRQSQKQSQAFVSDDSSLMALADYIEVAPAQLGLYQKTRRLFVQHGPHGQLRTAMTSNPGAQTSLARQPLMIEAS
ncbi:MAG: poly-beta-1,6-N-acetyl-D-glucosamine biosynthesis protein PgaD [Comamonadaceae bacterium]|nr:MAG: poly-beta-1,6-N-acetyl-D-glucosamine biosynthesis protein PgaD [Comamonadaceae bacterium]